MNGTCFQYEYNKYEGLLQIVPMAVTSAPVLLIARRANLGIARMTAMRFKVSHLNEMLEGEHCSTFPLYVNVVYTGVGMH